ncbi:hypothetical protein ACP4OV_029466 [Aristida adscensionis]
MTTEEKEEAARRRRRHRAVACCLALGMLVILGALALAFYFRYRPLPPRVVATPVDIGVHEFSVLPPALKVSVGAHVVVTNPSHAPFRHGTTASPVTYHGEPVGVTVVPAGEVAGKATAHIEPATVVDGLKVAASPHFAADAVAGVLPFVVVARVVGNALVLSTFEVPVAVEVVCYVRMYVFHGESSSRCVASVRAGPGVGSGSGSSGQGEEVKGYGNAEGAGKGKGVKGYGYPEASAYEHD